ncbi:hypothetical protein VV02_02570 [Luteipulveratus mongoliensis]|uniref:Uncharacterized protein n=1 Tax=Luteipulveratus mongoliensis TaxID=571913 RepID=A0A0K1JE73_9MICO|nr:hypothetical protein VV02_02570 [Luteipulveratus mongoliensis]
MITMARRTYLMVGAAALALTGSIVGSTPSALASGGGYELKTLRGGTTDGAAYSGGSVSFPDHLTAIIKITALADWCDSHGGGDSADAVLFVQIDNDSGWRRLISDDTGCGDGSISPRSIRLTAGGSVRLVLAECRNTESDSTCRSRISNAGNPATSVDFSRTFTNPN